MNLTQQETIAPLTNVAIAMRAFETVIERPLHLPGLTCFYGPSGFGKTAAATYAANKYEAAYVELRSIVTKKSLLQSIAKELGLDPRGTVNTLLDAIAEQLMLSEKPLILDEFQYLVEKQAVNVVMDIYESSQAPIIIVGEERLPTQLKRWERFHRRILHWAPAQPATSKDAKQLSKLYSADVDIQPDLLDKVMHVAQGSVGRISVNIEQIRDFAISEGLGSIDAARWGKRPLYTGHAPARRGQ